MIISGDSIPDGENVAADLCIVGGGPAGLTVAREFDGSSRRVYILETGREHLDEHSVQMSAGESVGHPYFSLESARARVLGGSSYIWGEWMRARPLDEIDFVARPWVPDSGWPLSRADLDPWYVRANELLGLGSFSYRAPEDEQSGMLPVDFHYSDTGDFTTARSWLEASANVILVTGATALGVEVDPSDNRRVRRVVASAGNPHRFAVDSQITVLCGGGIENARLLLLSEGVGRENDNVGRYFMEHPRVSRGRVDLIGNEVTVGDFALKRGSEHASRTVFAPTPRLMEERQILNGMLLLTPASRVEVSETRRSIAIVRDRVIAGKSSAESVSRHSLNVAMRPLEAIRVSRRTSQEPDDVTLRVSATVEQAPNRSSRVTLGDRLDPFGQPMARLDWQLGDLEAKTVRVMQEGLAELVEDAGWGRFDGYLGDERPARVMRGEWHQLGTTRMSKDPKSGVVDTNLKTHSLDDLYIAGGSVFPTVGYANPTLTVVALSLRLAAHLRERLEGLPALGPLW